jgi:hypothetical protein
LQDWWTRASDDCPDLSVIIQSVSSGLASVEINDSLIKLQFDQDTCLPVSIKTNSAQPRLVRFAEVTTEKLSRGVFGDLDESLDFVIRKYRGIVIEGNEDGIIES